MTLKLTDRSVSNHISPITQLDEVQRIRIVRDTPGAAIEKVEYVCPIQSRFRSPFFLAPIKLFHLIRISIKTKPSLIHGYLSFPHGYLALVAGKLTGRRVGVSMIAGPVETYTFGGSPINSFSYCRPLPVNGILSSAILYLLKRFDIITVTGTYTKKYLVDHGIAEDVIFILPHVVDDRFKPMPIDKDIDVVFVGRLAPVKHIETLIYAIEKLKRTRPSIRVVIVGEGESRSDLEELAAARAVNDQVEFAGYQDNAWEWYNRARISVLTSEREGFPYSVIESLACGVPVITSNCGDVMDVVRDGYNGRIIPDYEDHNAYADAIVELLEDPGLLRKYSSHCQETLLNNQSEAVEAEWKRILSILNE